MKMMFCLYLKYKYRIVLYFYHPGSVNEKGTDLSNEWRVVGVAGFVLVVHGDNALVICLRH